MASVNANPLVQGQLTDDPRWNERNGLSSVNLAFPIVYRGFGVPPNSLGANGDFFFRDDGTEAGHTLLYHREAGVWVATAA